MIVRKSIQATGGEGVLRAVHAMQAKVKGKMYDLRAVKGGQNDDTTFSGDIHSQPPHQSRAIWRINGDAAVVTMTQVHNHDKGWTREMDGESQAADPMTLTEMQQSDYVDYLASLIPLLDDKSLELSAVPDAKVQGRTCCRYSREVEGSAGRPALF